MSNKKCGISYDFIKGTSTSNLNLVFVHGTGCNRNFLRPLADELRQYNRYLIDLPGHGDSDNTDYSPENYVDAVYDFISDMENVILIGHSLGGTIVIGAGERNIKSIKGLVILNSGASFPKIDSILLEKLQNNILDFDRFGLLLGNIDDPEMQKSISHMENTDTILKDAFISIDINYEEDLNKIKVPVCIIAGGKDKFTFPEFSENLNYKIKNSKLYIISEAMHSMPIIKKKETSKLISDFIKDI